MRKSLEDIKIQKTRTIIQTDTSGIDRHVNQTINQKLKVKTIKDGLRIVHLVVDYFIFYSLTLIFASIPFLTDLMMPFYGLILFLAYPLMYLLMEFKFQQTPGKMATKHVVINEYAEAPDFSTCLLRTLIRFVPFHAFSCFGKYSRGWHDSWTKTYVVHKDEVPKLKELLEKENSKEN